MLQFGDHVARLEAETLRDRAGAQGNDRDAVAFVDAEFVGQAGENVRDAGAVERMRADKVAHIVFAGLGWCGERKIDCDWAAIAEQIYAGGVADAAGCQPVVHGAGIGDFEAVDAGDHVARLEACRRTWSAVRDARDDGAGDAVETQSFGDLARDGLEEDAEPGTLDLAACGGALDVETHEVGGDREADALRAAGLAEDHRVDADQASGHVDERTTGVAGVDGGIGLNEDLAVGFANLGAGERGDDAGRDGLADPEWIADGEDEIADFERVAVFEGDGGEAAVAAFDLEDGDVGLVVLHDDAGIEFALVGERHADLRFAAPFDDVRVGDDRAVWRDDDAGAQRRLDALGGSAEAFAEELAEEGIVGERRGERLHAAANVDVDDGGRGFAGDGRKGILHHLARRRHLLLLSRPSDEVVATSKGDDASRRPDSAQGPGGGAVSHA